MKILNGFSIALMLASLGCSALILPPPRTTAPQPPPTPGQVTGELRADPLVAPYLVSLIDESRLRNVSPADYDDTALKDLQHVFTPEAYRLKYRYYFPAVPLAQALAYSRSKPVQQRLLETARWAGNTSVRSEGLLGLAWQKNKDNLKYFKEALVDPDIAIQFGALEGLAVFGPDGVPYLRDAAQRAWSPIIRVFAAQLLARQGDAQGLQRLRANLTSNSWLERAMSARYLGEVGKKEDADLLLSRIGPENDNRYVLAEVCVAALRLGATKVGASMPVPNAPPSRTSTPRKPLSAASPFELEPIVITAPRLQMTGANVVDPRIDTSLVALLEKIATEPPPQEQVVDPALADLSKLKTPQGFALFLRYWDLSLLLTEGLAGTSNYTLIQRLETIARENPDSRIRGAAIVSLGYDRFRTSVNLFSALMADQRNEPGPLNLRFAAVEALSHIDPHLSKSLVAQAATSDVSPALRVYASYALHQMGDPYGRVLLLNALSDQDWVIRSIALYYLGQMGYMEDYDSILFRLGQETRDPALVEACLALLKLSLQEIPQ